MNPAERSELARLVNRARRGDSFALSDLLRRYERKIYGFCYRCLSSFRYPNPQEAAEDVAQETFKRAIEKLVSLDDAMRFEPWLYRIANNLCWDEWRSTRRMVNLPEGLDPPDPKLSQQEELHKHLQFERVMETVASLPDEQREPLLLVHYEHQSYEQAAEILGIPIGTVKSRVFRAIDSLQQLLKDDEG